MWLGIAPAAMAAETALDDCALARDPARCEARQKAIASCADMHGAYKRACLEAALPAVDCGRAKNPTSCERAQNAKAAAREACQGKPDQDARQCMREETRKQKQATKASASKGAKAKTSGKSAKATKATKATKAKTVRKTKKAKAAPKNSG